MLSAKGLSGFKPRPSTYRAKAPAVKGRISPVTGTGTGGSFFLKDSGETVLRNSLECKCQKGPLHRSTPNIMIPKWARKKTYGDYRKPYSDKTHVDAIL